MRFAPLIAAAAALAVLAGSAMAQTTTVTTKKRVAVRPNQTVITSRDENGRTRTRIVVEKRSFLDPGTQVFPGEQRYNSGTWAVWTPAFSGPQDNTAFSHTYPLPGRFDLPFPDNPIGPP